MDNQNSNFQDPLDIQSVSSDVASKTFMSRVFSWMFLGLVVTGLTALLFATDASLKALIFETTTRGMSLTPLGWIAMLSPLALILLMRFGFDRLSYATMMLTFLVYSLLTGMSMSVIFMVYAASSIYSVFFITAGMFGVMALLGYTTQIDLTKMGSILYMVLVGVIISMLGNYFILHSQGVDYMLSFVCVGIFTGLTAYKVQVLKNIGAQIGSTGDATMGKMSVYGALTLYITFINLFWSLLRIMGNRK